MTLTYGVVVALLEKRLRLHVQSWWGVAMTITWPLTDGRITLRPATLDDAEAIFALQRRPQVQQHISRTTDTVEEAKTLIRERTQDPEALFCVIELDSRVVGQIGGKAFTPDSLGAAPKTRDFHLGYAVAPEAWGQGIATAAVKILVSALHEKEGIRRIVAKVFTENQASLRVLAEAGFVLEGTERASVLGRNGKWLDDCTLSHFVGD